MTMVSSELSATASKTHAPEPMLGSGLRYGRQAGQKLADTSEHSQYDYQLSEKGPRSVPEAHLTRVTPLQLADIELGLLACRASSVAHKWPYWSVFYGAAL